MASTPAITFDESGRVRVLDSSLYKKMEETQTLSRSFLSNMSTFADSVDTMVTNLEKEADIIEHAKLRVCEAGQGRAALPGNGPTAVTDTDGILTPHHRAPALAQQALGARNAVAHEQDVRARKQAELSAQLHERTAELERLKAQLESLQRVEQEQRDLVEQLTNHEA